MFMKQQTRLLSRDEFIRRLGKDITLYPNEIHTIKKHWDSITATAASLLPQIPDIGFFSSRKRLQAYTAVEQRLTAMTQQGTVDKQLSGYILLLLSYSSRKFARAFDASNDKEFSALDFLKINTRQLWLNIPLALLFLLVLEYQTQPVEKLLAYNWYYPQQQAQGIITRSQYSGRWGYTLQYDFEVNGRKYTATWLNFHAYTPQDKQHARKAYPPGTKATVFYHQQQPRYAVLERKAPNIRLYALMFATLCLSYLALTISWGREPRICEKG